ncbi:MAG TPA: protein kinase [Ktedonobacteraceae bacterium]|nr:protein kinase [Ktedonobacteraceae bacterium]
MNGSLKIGTLLVGRYRILERIGDGGFGTVYKARDRRRLGKLVAVKEINMAELSVQEKIEVTDSFNREISLLSKLRHPNLPRIHAHFTDPEHWYIVMDYIEGETLEDLLARSPKGRLSVQQTARIGVALCEVLSYLHYQHPSIIFRDVKPGNIMHTFWEQLYLIDFGIARRYREGQMRDTGPLGSPGYAAPEQYGRLQSTPQTDIYGLGMTLQTLLTGREPLEIRLQGTPTDVHIPQKLQALINQMIDPDPSRRPRGVGEVKRALQPYALSSWYRQGIAFTSGLNINIFILVLRNLHSSFEATLFLVPCLLLVLAFLVGSCIFALLRTRRTISLRLSLKATMIIMGKQLLFSLGSAFLLIGWASLLSIFLIWPSFAFAHLFLHLLYGGVLIIITLIGFIEWLKRRPPRRATMVQQELPMQQQRRP